MNFFPDLIAYFKQMIKIGHHETLDLLKMENLPTIRY
jgi:hypothetical protein